jgi:pimeloyl-ACP methyl ester carboxylesterase
MTTSHLPGEPLPAIVRGAGPGLLLAHGAGGTPELNFPFLDRLARRATVVAPPYPGRHPAPPAVRPLDADELADRLVASALAAGVESFTVVGYSLGAALATRIAARHPTRVQGLVLTAGFAHARPSFQALAAVWRALLDGPREPLAHFLALTCSSASALASLTSADYAATVDALVDLPIPPGTPDQVELVRRIDVRGDLAAIAVPTVVVVPTGDLLVAPVHSRELAQGIARATTVELDSGHLVGVDRPDAWLAAIDGLLDEVTLAAGTERHA